MIMTIVFAVTTIALALVCVYGKVLRDDAEAQTRKYRRLWGESTTQRAAEESLIYEWSNRDLMPDWEDAYPHVEHMPNERKYSEWATFCANYPTREQMIAQISLDSANRRARATRGD